MAGCEPCQVWKEAALSSFCHVPQGNFGGAFDLFGHFGQVFKKGCTAFFFAKIKTDQIGLHKSVFFFVDFIIYSSKNLNDIFDKFATDSTTFAQRMQIGMID